MSEFTMQPGETKICSSCEEPLPLSEFHRDRTHKDGYKSNCKSCRSGRPKEPNEISRIREEYKNKTEAELETIARSKAIKRVIENHYDEFTNLLSRYRREVGVKPRWVSLD